MKEKKQMEPAAKDDWFDVVTTNECTGLIPAMPEDEAQVQNYSQLGSLREKTQKKRQ